MMMHSPSHEGIDICISPPPNLTTAANRSTQAPPPAAAAGGGHHAHGGAAINTPVAAPGAAAYEDPDVLQRCRVCLIDDNHGNGGGDGGSVVHHVVRLPHPGCGKPAMYVIRQPQQHTGGNGDGNTPAAAAVDVLEMVSCRRAVGECSMFVGNTLIADGRLHLVVRIDPLFLFIPLLKRARGEGTGRYCPLTQTLDPPPSDHRTSNVAASSSSSHTHPSQHQDVGSSSSGQGGGGSPTDRSVQGGRGGGYSYEYVDNSGNGCRTVMAQLMRTQDVRHRIVLICDTIPGGPDGDDVPLVRLSYDKLAQFIQKKMDRIMAVVKDTNLYVNEVCSSSVASAADDVGDDPQSEHTFDINTSALRGVAWELARAQLEPQLRQIVADILKIDEGPKSDLGKRPAAAAAAPPAPKQKAAKPKPKAKPKAANPRDVKGMKKMTDFFAKK
ncbi:unnamed protein product [Vitrella brassicaformis CCMP3155]|uniref:Uncharacterized protein n=1 Tax=Vitrella brassicaformis (strain CCMP3155) TaxID=1169540 RepID=A0A0G4EG75_VITBC|nr:unnamed protein product [Vitrella brassicaformis CCMP3155]|eukprot:CEL95521.1 unnamed protein product [Vitrella brassicaformis CCMP3155]